MGLIVLVVRPTSAELELLLLTIPKEVSTDEGRVVIGIHAK